MGRAAWCKACSSHRRKPTLAAERKAKGKLLSSGMKRCNVCEVTKALNEFNVRVASPDGRCATCRTCAKRRLAQWRKNNPNGFADWLKNNAGRQQQNWATWSRANRDRVRQNYKLWAASNRDKINANGARRHATKLRATVKWGNRDAIRSVYERAAAITRDTGVPHHVDHIVPLCSPIVCGLHWEGNLQVITSDENHRKYNKFRVLCGPGSREANA